MLLRHVHATHHSRQFICIKYVIANVFHLGEQNVINSSIKCLCCANGVNEIGNQRFCFITDLAKVFFSNLWVYLRVVEYPIAPLFNHPHVMLHPVLRNMSIALKEVYRFHNLQVMFILFRVRISTIGIH